MIRFITYSTPGEYRGYAKKMIASAEKVGLEIHHYEEPAFPRWRDALYHKAAVIARAMKEYPEEDICWIDADAEFRGHPTLLYQIPATRRVAAYCEKAQGGRVLWGGTLWFRRGNESQDLIRLWQEENSGEGQGYIDDNNLLWTIMKAKRKPWLCHLPPAYFWVQKYFPQRFPGATPVILQHCRGMGGNNVKKQKEAPFRPWTG